MNGESRVMMSNRNRLPARIGISAAILVAVVTGSACGLTDDDPGEPVVDVPGGDTARGQDLISAYGCNACHTIPGVDGADATVGPPLTEFAEREYIAGSLENTPENLIRWVMNPQEVEPGTAMPDMGVTEADARDIAAYLYTRD